MPTRAALLAGRYRLDKPVGQGGMSVVWRAHDLRLDRTVAVKMLTPEFAADLRWHGRARAEAQATARLAHRGIARVYDVGEYTPTANLRVPYIVMELVDGETLRNRLERGALDYTSALSTCAEIADALAAAHARGIVHRDVKPGNVILTDHGVKVVDFGIAAMTGQAPADASGYVLGTPDYMAPEQLCGDAVTPASDVYGLGLVLFECLTGRPLWANRQARLAASTVPTPSVGHLPPGVVEICSRCLLPSPGERPTSRHLADLLRTAPVGIPFAREPTGAGRTTLAAAAISTSPAMSATPAVSTAPVRHRARRARWTPAAAAVVSVLAAAALVGANRYLDRADGQAAMINQDPGCQTRYAARRLTDGTFRASLMITTAVAAGNPGWSLTFTLPRGQKIIAVDGAHWAQTGGQVALRSEQALKADNPVVLTLVGAPAAKPVNPTGFSLDGAACQPATSLVGWPPPETAEPTQDDTSRDDDAPRPGSDADHGPRPGPSTTTAGASPSPAPSGTPSAPSATPTPAHPSTTSNPSPTPTPPPTATDEPSPAPHSGTPSGPAPTTPPAADPAPSDPAGSPGQ
jgi:hypothetical protein